MKVILNLCGESDFEIAGTPEELKHLEKTKKEIQQLREFLVNNLNLEYVFTLEERGYDPYPLLEDAKRLVQMVELHIKEKTKKRWPKYDQRLFDELVEANQLIKIDEDEKGGYYVYSSEQAEKFIRGRRIGQNKYKAFQWELMEDRMNLILNTGLPFDFVWIMERLLTYIDYLNRKKEGLK